jgi:hypothetical protein
VPALPLAAVQSLLDQGLLVPIGGGAAILAMIGMVMLLPLFIAQRREIGRLIDWYEREPDAGDTGPPAAPAPTLVRSGPMTAAERVTSERPALARIGTSERAAIELEQASLWGRIVIRGPRHPLVLSLIALFVAVAVIVTAGLLLRANSESSGRGAGLDRSAVTVVVLNASSSPGLAGSVGDGIVKDGFNVTATSVADKPLKRSVVEYASIKGAKAEAKAVARSLGIRVSGHFDTDAESKAEGAHVVVIAGDDLAKHDTAKAPDGKD